VLRYITLVALSALIGSALGTIVLIGWAGGTGASDSIRVTIGFALITMFFTCPGAVMLLGLQALLDERGFGLPGRDIFLLIFGAMAGAAIISLMAIHMAPLGSVYALSTAIALLSLQRLTSWIAKH
jgi:hypothetical protein